MLPENSRTLNRLIKRLHLQTLSFAGCVTKQSILNKASETGAQVFILNRRGAFAIRISVGPKDKETTGTLVVRPGEEMFEFFPRADSQCGLDGPSTVQRLQFTMQAVKLHFALVLDNMERSNQLIPQDSEQPVEDMLFGKIQNGVNLST